MRDDGHSRMVVGASRPPITGQTPSTPKHTRERSSPCPPTPPPTAPRVARTFSCPSQGDCVFGHPRSSLRGIYQAEIDKRTGYPKPPSTEQRAASLRHSTAPVAPIALPVDIAPGPAISLDRQFDADWPVKVEHLSAPPIQVGRCRAGCPSIPSSGRWARACPRRWCSRTCTASSGGCSVRRAGDTQRVWPLSGRRKASTRRSSRSRGWSGKNATGSGDRRGLGAGPVRTAPGVR